MHPSEHAGSQGDGVLCPICCKFALAESNGLIVCRCGAFRLDCRVRRALWAISHKCGTRRSPGNSQTVLQPQLKCGRWKQPQTEGGTLSHLRQALANSHDEHYAGGCRSPLRYAVEVRFGVNALFGYCDACKAFLMIA